MFRFRSLTAAVTLFALVFSQGAMLLHMHCCVEGTHSVNEASATQASVAKSHSHCHCVHHQKHGGNQSAESCGPNGSSSLPLEAPHDSDHCAICHAWLSARDANQFIATIPAVEVAFIGEAVCLYDLPFLQAVSLFDAPTRGPPQV